MYNVSQAFLDAVMAPERDVALRLHVTDADGNNYDLTDEDVLQGSVKLTGSGVSGDTFAPGGVSASDLAATLLNKEGRFDDVQFNGGV